MSFILDALRKSDHERRRNEAPGIASTRSAAPAKSRPMLLATIAVLLTVNLGVVAFLMFRDQTGQSLEVAREPAVTARTTAPGDRVLRALASEAVPSRGTIVDSAPPPEAPGETVVAPVGQPVNLPSEPVDAAPEPSGTDPGSDMGLSTLQEMMVQGGVQLPTMHLDIHVYSENSADRFVFINMRKYREGETLSEGPRVQEIVSEGVVLEHENQPFLLTRH